MEVVLEFGRCGAEGDDFVGQQVRLDRRDAVAVDPLDVVQGTQQVDETLARRPAEIPRIDPRDDDLALAPRCYAAGLFDQFGNGLVAARPAGIVDRTVGATVVAAVLHLEEGPRTVAAREGREERRELVGIATVDLRSALARKFNHPFI